jgi:hypothetical protein
MRPGMVSVPLLPSGHHGSLSAGAASALNALSLPPASPLRLGSANSDTAAAAAAPPTSARARHNWQGHVLALPLMSMSVSSTCDPVARGSGQ